MKAEEMFEKLGYELDINVLDIIRYSKEEKDLKSVIRFNVDEKTISTNSIVNNDLWVLDITLEELQAINQQAKELGWYE
jgi:hypothetical protein